MSKDKSKRDTVSQEEYNRQVESISTAPEYDSPGDSEDDAESEFLVGLNYMPDEKNEFENPGEEPGEIVFSDGHSGPQVKNYNRIREIPETAKVISSGQPEPWSDLDSPSDTH